MRSPFLTLLCASQLSGCLVISDEDLKLRLGGDSAAQDDTGAVGPGDDSGGETDSQPDTHDTGIETGHTGDTGVPDTSDSSDTDTDTSGCSTDGDGDGHIVTSCGGDDCSDGDATVYPGAEEICDGIDNDCDGDDAEINAIYFDSTYDALTFSDASSLEMGGEWTVEAWVLLNTATGSVFTKADGLTSEDEYKSFRIVAGVPVATFTNEDHDTVTATSTGTVPSGAWVHLAWVGKSETVYTYVNGVSAGSASGRIDPLDESASGALGSLITVGGTAFTGYLSDVRISDKAQYTGSFTPSGTLGSDGDTKVYWPLDEGTGSSVRSSVGGVTATLSGATWSTAPCRP